MNPVPFRQALDRIHAEYREMPGMRLTAGQVQRLCGVDHVVCGLVLETLVQARFLRLEADGNYRRSTDGASDGPTTTMAMLAERSPLKWQRGS